MDVLERIAALGFCDGAGREADEGERHWLAERCAPVDDVGAIAPETVIRICRLPFHASMDLAVAADPGWTPAGAALCVLRRGDDLWRLDGASAPIHEANAAAGIALDAGTVLPYLRFFCFFVRGAEGPFLVVEGAGNPLVPEANRDRLRAAVVPPEILGRDRKGAWHVAAFVHYGDTLAAARFRLAPSGMVEMLDDDLLLRDLPARIAAPISLAEESD